MVESIYELLSQAMFCMLIAMKNSDDITAKASQNIADRLLWQTAHKDQAGISRDLASGKDIPEVYGLGEAGLFDEFFFFLDNFGISGRCFSPPSR